MFAEMKIDTSALLRWIMTKIVWILILCIGTSVICAGLLFWQDVNNYNKAAEKLYSQSELEEMLNDEQQGNVKMVISLDALILERMEMVEALMEKDDFENTAVEQAQLQGEIDSLDFRRAKYTYDFSPEEVRYYQVLTNQAEYKDSLTKPRFLCGHILLGGIVGGVVIALAFAVLCYILMGYLHSHEELEWNFKYHVCEIKEADKEFLEKLRFFATSENLCDEKSVVVTGQIDWKDEKNKAILDVIQEVVPVKLVEELEETMDCFNKINDSKIILVERVNDSKLYKIQKDHMVINKGRGNVICAFLIR